MPKPRFSVLEMIKDRPERKSGNGLQNGSNLRPVGRPEADMMQPHNALRIDQHIAAPLPDIA
jgi:hypothetical protein